MAEAVGDRADVHAGADQLRRREVPEVVEPDLHARALCKTGEGGGDRVGLDGFRPGRVEALRRPARQDVAVVEHRDAGLLRPPLDALAVAGQ